MTCICQQRAVSGNHQRDGNGNVVRLRRSGPSVNERDQFKVTWADLHGNKHVATFDADLNRVDDE